MMNQRSARELVLDLLIEFEEKEAYSNLLLDRHLKDSNLNQPDRRLVTELVYGVIQRLRTLDWWIDQLVKKGSNSLDAWVKQVLRMGIYQLEYLDKVPHRAAVFETVQLAKKRGHRGIEKLVNGVLRSFLRKREQLQPTDPAVLYAYPDWMLKRMEEVYGRKTALAMMESTLLPPKVSLRVNPLKSDREAILQQFADKAKASPLSKDGVIVQQVGNPAHHEGYEKGYYTMQDESSMLVADAVQPKPGMRVLDACAAPGGKTTHLAERMLGQGEIIACDLHPHKIQLIQSHAKRLDLPIIEPKIRDMRKEKLIPTFDAILLDAPCSGWGVIRRKPEIKWRKSKDDLQSLIQLQHDLLNTCAEGVKVGGALIYSTCTWEPMENQQQVESFLSRNPQFELDSTWVSRLPTIVREGAIQGDGWLQILPQHFQSDGFFIARFIRRK